MTELAFRKPSTMNTASISSEFGELHERQFASRQQRTASATLMSRETEAHGHFVRSIRSVSQSPVPYDPVIVRFYEDIIQELQRELAKYQRMVQQVAAAVEETETGYSVGPPVVLSNPFREKVLVTVSPSLRPPDLEV